MATAQDWLIQQEDQLHTSEHSGVVFVRGNAIDLILPVTSCGEDFNWQIMYFRWSLTRADCVDLLKRWKAHQELQKHWPGIWSINWGDITHAAVPYEHEPWEYFRNVMFKDWDGGMAERVDTTFYSYNGGFFWTFRYDRADIPVDWECEPVSPKVIENLQTVEIPPEGVFIKHLEG